MESRSSQRSWTGQVLCFFCLYNMGWVSGQIIRYSIVEESELGTVVGNLAQDLGMNVAAIPDRRLRLSTQSSRRYFAVNVGSGTLTVNEKLDRESLCGSSWGCVLPVEVVIENPLKLFRLEVEILDINDNSPSFVTSNRLIRIAESAAPGSRFPLESAHDPDVGTNDISAYRLNQNPFFSLNVGNHKDKLFPELVLEKVLDRELIEKHHLILTAFDGGNPVRSGTVQIIVIVLDINDNAPVFDHSVYRVSLIENSPLNTVVIHLNASDMDEGINGEIEYSFEDHTLDLLQRIFKLNSHTGEVLVQGIVDFEESAFYEISVRARDKGVPEMEGHCLILVEIEDVNDNIPELMVTSLVNSIPENTPVGTAVGIFNVNDEDSGENGEVRLQISPDLPFEFIFFENHYTLMTSAILDREKVSQYTLELTATDLGSPPLKRETIILLNISDINDNFPTFSQPSYNAYMKENNQPGSLLCTVSASDPDESDNSYLTYSIVETQIQDSSVSSFVYINSHNGNIYAQRSFDYELLQVLHIQILVQDAGSPKLSSTTTVYLYVLDQNDNSPTILYPVTSGELVVHQRIPQSVPVDYFVTKVTAVDADSGYNAWLSYSLLQATDSSLFRVTASTGEIRTIQSFQDTESQTQRLLILVKDNGEPALSTTVTILLSLEKEVHEERTKLGSFLKEPPKRFGMTLYLIIALVAITIISLLTFIILAVRCVRKEQSSSNSSYLHRSIWRSKELKEQPNPTLHENSDNTLKYIEVSMSSAEPQNQCYKTCFSPVSESNNDFTFMASLNFPDLKHMLNETDASLSGNDGLNELCQVRGY